MTTDNYIVPGLQNGIILLNMMAEFNTPLSLVDLSKQSGIAKTTVFRILHTLILLELVEKNNKTNTFSLGVGVLKLGFWKLSKMELTEIGQAPLEALRDATGHSAHIVIRQGKEAVYIARAASKNKVVASGIGPGTHLPLYNTGVGRMLIAHYSKDDLEGLYPDELISSPGYKSSSKSILWELLQNDNRNGFVISESFFEQGISSVVYPIKHLGDTKAVVTLTIPANSIPNEEKGNLQLHVKEAAQKIAERLRYHR